MMSSLPPNVPYRGVDDIRQIAAVTDQVIRNLQITQCYHELMTAVVERTGPVANWCTFATWASRQAGQTIRKEDLRRALEDALRNQPYAAQAAPDVAAAAQALGSTHTQAEIQETLADVLNPSAAFDRAGDAVARGNKKVFEEIGYEFARFNATCLYDPAYDSASIARFCDELRPGDPPDGQRYLRQAFLRYYQALFEEDAKIRSESMFLANLEIGLHEQTRLQPEIAQAMDAAFVDGRQFRLRLIKALFPYRGWLTRVRLFLLHLFDQPSPFDAAVESLLTDARRLTRLVMTDVLMTIGLPNGARLRLGEDVPLAFPASLQVITQPDLREFLQAHDPTPDSVRGSGAVDWALLPERLHFIIDFFRCCHETSALFQPPFAPEQVAALKAGRRPAGRL